jgi:WD40 repeat protein
VVALRWHGTEVVLGLANGQVKVWDSVARRVVRTWTQPGDRVMALAVSDDGALLAAGSDDGHVYVWAFDSGALRFDIPADAGELQVVAFSGDELIASGTSRRLHRWALRP